MDTKQSSKQQVSATDVIEAAEAKNLVISDELEILRELVWTLEQELSALNEKLEDCCEERESCNEMLTDCNREMLDLNINLQDSQKKLQTEQEERRCLEEKFLKQTEIINSLRQEIGVAHHTNDLAQYRDTFVL